MFDSFKVIQASILYGMLWLFPVTDIDIVVHITENQTKNLKSCFTLHPLFKNQQNNDLLKTMFFFVGFYCTPKRCINQYKRSILCLIQGGHIFKKLNPLSFP